MLRSDLSSYIGTAADDEPGERTIADRFVQVMVCLNLEYNLSPDVLDAAEDILQALKATERPWPTEQAEQLAWRC
jgi:hypothetical protein